MCYPSSKTYHAIIVSYVKSLAFVKAGGGEHISDGRQSPLFTCRHTSGTYTNQESPRITPEAFPLLKDDYADIRKALLPVSFLSGFLRSLFLFPVELYNKVFYASMHDKSIRKFSQILHF